MKREDLGVLSPAEKEIARKPDAMEVVTLSVCGLETEILVEVHGSRDEREGYRFRVDEIKHEGTYLTHLFADEQLEAIARQIK